MAGVFIPLSALGHGSPTVYLSIDILSIGEWSQKNEGGRWGRVWDRWKPAAQAGVLALVDGVGVHRLHGAVAGIDAGGAALA
jgi:hypothetical protein